MTPRLARVLAKAAVVLLLVTASLSAQRFTSGVEVVSVPASVTEKGKAVTGLVAADFVLTDNGVPQIVEVAALEEMPIDVSLVIDASQSVQGALLTRLKKAVAETAALLTHNDRIRVIAVQHVIREIVRWQPGGGTPSLDALTGSGSTSIYDALAAALMRSSPDGRRHLVVVFTDGFDTSSVVAPDALTSIAALSDTVVNAVIAIEDLKERRSTQSVAPSAGNARGGSLTMGLTPADEQQLPSVRPLRDAVVLPTGGQVFAVDMQEPLSGTFSAAVRAFRTSYVLRYIPMNVATPGWHSIAVTVHRPNRYEIRARKGYSR